MNLRAWFMCNIFMNPTINNIHTGWALTGWMQQDFLHPVPSLQWATFSWGTWVYRWGLADSVAEGVTKVCTYGEKEHAKAPAHFRICNPHTQWHVQERPRAHHKPFGGNFQVRACREGKPHQKWRVSGLWRAIDVVVVWMICSRLGTESRRKVHCVRFYRRMRNK